MMTMMMIANISWRAVYYFLCLSVDLIYFDLYTGAGVYLLKVVSS